MLDRAERVGHPVAQPVAHEHQGRGGLSALRAGRRHVERPPGRRRGATRVPGGASQHPRDRVLEAAEPGPLTITGAVQAKAVLGVNVTPAPGASIRSRVWHVSDLRSIVLEGGETGQELLEESVRLLDPAVIALGHDGAENASQAIYGSVMQTVDSGVSTDHLGGHAATSEFTSAVIEAVRDFRAPGRF